MILRTHASGEKRPSDIRKDSGTYFAAFGRASQCLEKDAWGRAGVDCGHSGSLSALSGGTVWRLIATPCAVDRECDWTQGMPSQ